MYTNRLALEKFEQQEQGQALQLTFLPPSSFLPV